MRRVPVRDLRPGMLLARAVYSQGGHLLLGAGVELNDRYLQILRSRGFSYVDVDDPATDDLEIADLITERTRLNVTRDTYRIMNVLEGAIRPLRDQEMTLVHDQIASEAFGEAARDAVGYESLVDDLRTIVDEVYGQALLPGLTTIRSFDNYLFLHSIDTTVVAVMIGITLGFDRARLHQLAAGCILHDIGMVMIDPAMLLKPGRLDASELNRIRQHPRIGYEMLRQIRPRDVIPNHVAYQHHERQDATGYPRGLHGTGRVKRTEAERHRQGRILLDAEICAVADVYDALGADRPHRPALPPDQVVRTLRAMAGLHLNREIVEHLLAILPVYPLGSEVLVQTGPYAHFRGVVCRVDREHLERPTVRLLFNRAGERIEPIELDLRHDETVIASAPGGREPAPTNTATPTRPVPPPGPAAPPRAATPDAPPVVTPIATPLRAEAADDAPPGGRILVVEDDQLVREILDDSLREAGYQVTSVGSGRDGLALAAEADLILLDLGLPDIDGVAVCRAIRSVPDLARLPIMMLTARGDPVDRVLGIQSGADDYLAKPFDLAELLARVEALLRARQIEARLRARTQQLELLRHLLRTIVSTASPAELGQKIVDAVPAAFGPEAGVIGAILSTVDARQRRMQAHVVTDTPAARRALELLRRPLREVSGSFDPPRNLMHQVALDGQPRAGAHLSEFISPEVPPATAQAIERIVGMRGGLAHPVRVHGDTVGVFLFLLTRPAEVLTSTERTLIQELADTAAIAVDNARMHAALGAANAVARSVSAGSAPTEDAEPG